MVDDSYRGQGVGKVFLEWVYNHAKSKGCEASELNAYTNNPKSHKFYYNKGYEIFGFHLVKILRKNVDFY